MSEDQKELAKVIEKYFGADAGYLDIDCFTLARRIIEAGWTKVVTCKDCKHFVAPQGVACCDNFFGLGFPNPSGDDFCSYGKRRD